MISIYTYVKSCLCDFVRCCAMLYGVCVCVFVMIVPMQCLMCVWHVRDLLCEVALFVACAVCVWLRVLLCVFGCDLLCKFVWVVVVCSFVCVCVRVLFVFVCCVLRCVV